MNRLLTKEDRLLTRKLMIPAGAIKIAPKAADVEFYLYTANGNPCAMCFIGSAAKPAWRYRFRSTDERDKRIISQIESCKARDAAQEQYKAKRNVESKLEVGHILKTSWGYDQTNVEFYQITEKKGKRTVVLRELAQVSAGESSSMSGHVLPTDKMIGKPITCRVKYGDSVSIEGKRYLTAHLWSGQPAFTSSWA